MNTTPSPAPTTRRRLLNGLGILAVAALAALALTRFQNATAQDHVPWRTDLDAAIAEAAETRRPVLILATAAWCGPCQQLKADVFADPADAAQIGDRFVPVKLAHGTADAAMADLGVQGLPTLILLRPDGREIGRQIGYRGRDALMDWLGTAATTNLAATD